MTEDEDTDDNDDGVVDLLEHVYQLLEALDHFRPLHLTRTKPMLKKNLRESR